jgi:hypothetical protein
MVAVYIVYMSINISTVNIIILKEKNIPGARDTSRLEPPLTAAAVLAVVRHGVVAMVVVVVVVVSGSLQVTASLYA